MPNVSYSVWYANGRRLDGTRIAVGPSKTSADARRAVRDLGARPSTITTMGATRP